MAINDLKLGAIAILVTVILVGVGIIFLQNMADIGVREILPCVTEENDTFVANGSVAQNLDHPHVCAITAIINTTGNWTYSANNYTVVYGTGDNPTTILWSNTSDDVNDTVYANYTYGNANVSFFQGINDSTKALADLSDWWPIIILALCIGVVLFFIMRSLSMRTVA